MLQNNLELSSIKKAPPFLFPKREQCLGNNLALKSHTCYFLKQYFLRVVNGIFALFLVMP